MESPEAPALGGDWSPRISFSYGFESKPRIPSPAHSPAHDSEFEFSSFPSVDLTPKWHMLCADELFCDGKLRVVDESSEFGMTEHEEGEVSENDISVCRGNAGPTRSNSEMESAHAFEGKPSTIGGAGKVAGDGAESTTKERAPAPCPIETARTFTDREGLLYSSYKKHEKERLPKQSRRGNAGSALKADVGERANELKGPASSKDAALLESLTESKCKAAPTAREDARSSVKNAAAGDRRGGPLRSTASREELLLARERLGENKAETQMAGSEAANRKQMSPSIAGKCKELRTPVQWREAVQKSKENERSSPMQWRRFSKSPRSASMTVDDFSQLAQCHTACVSLDNSRCPSPSRSFSLPATTPTSPTASGSSAFLASSSSRHASRLKDFFKLKRLSSKDAELSSLASRIPLSARFFFPFLKTTKASNTTNISDAASTLPQQAREQPGLSLRYTSQRCAMKEERVAAPGKCHASPLQGFEGNAQIARPPSEQAAVASLRPLSIPKGGGLPSLSDKNARSHTIRQSAVPGRDEIVWVDANSTNNNKGTRKGSVMSSGGALARHHSKSLERPMPYTSSVRVTPLLNVSSCIISPSPRNSKAPSDLKPFSLHRLFRGAKPKRFTERHPRVKECSHHHTINI